MKPLFVERCHQAIVLLDATKWGKVGLASFARFEDVDTVITDVDAPADLVEQAHSLGVEVILV